MLGISYKLHIVLYEYIDLQITIMSLVFVESFGIFVAGFIRPTRVS